MTTLVDRLRAHVGRTGQFRDPGTAIVAVSGGPDSVALLDLLHEAALPGIGLVVAHADHGIQPGSAAVAEQVGRLAASYGLPFELGRLALGPGASETVARRARYAWLRDVQRRRGVRYLVTAHHRDDQVETVLLRVLRGSGLAGLAGIPARARGGLVRPLLP
ncbi:MAG: tRNA lysidine(34) synthetase TilS, partial [Gemmatimonadales bacterium]